MKEKEDNSAHSHTEGSENFDSQIHNMGRGKPVESGPDFEKIANEITSLRENSSSLTGTIYSALNDAFFSGYGSAWMNANKQIAELQQRVKELENHIPKEWLDDAAKAVNQQTEILIARDKEITELREKVKQLDKYSFELLAYGDSVIARKNLQMARMSARKLIKGVEPKEEESQEEEIDYDAWAELGNEINKRSVLEDDFGVHPVLDLIRQAKLFRISRISPPKD